MSLLSGCWSRSIPRQLSRPAWRNRFFATSFVLRENEGRSLSRTNYEAKYADKLLKKAEEAGISLDELRERGQATERARQKEKWAPSTFALKKQHVSESQAVSSATTSASTTGTTIRKDSSPVKPLNSILNFDKLLQNPLTAAQLTELWHGYHQRLSGGTGRGYLSAVIPVDTYEQMLSVAQKYPQFVVPLPREATAEEDSKAEAVSSADQKPYEFYFMEWGFHGSPSEPRPVTSVIDDLLTKNAPPPSSNPHTSTVLFTPLGEYKQRNSFATPYLVLTFYSDLAGTHGIVLLRGEITPGSGAESGEARYLLSQLDAQALAMAMQKFYLWSKLKTEGESPANDPRSTLIKTFHEDPANFKWEDLLKHA